MTDPLNIFFVDLCTSLQGSRIEYSCQYIPQGHYFSTLWLWSTAEHVF